VTDGPLTLAFDRAAHPEGLRVLALGAHADDIEIGCGGTMLRLAAEGLVSAVRWVVLSASGEREAEARAGAGAFLDGVGQAEVLIGGFRDGFFPYLGGMVKDYFEDSVRAGFDPDLILTHRRDDLHQDHRLTGELTWNTFRRHLILEYEVPKYDGDLTTPNLYVELSEATSERKIELIGATYQSQSSRTWFDPSTFRAILRLRGMESGAGSRLAEGFTSRKAVI
jgi:LmbE family N-acetylglucosaminyl deacetylase